VSREQAEELGLLVKAGWRVVALETSEEDRALRLLERVAEATKRPLHTWSSTAGIGGAGAGSLAGCLEVVAGREEPALFAVLDAHRVLDQPEGVRALRDALSEIGRRRQVLVLIGPVIDLPLELEREVARISLPLPNAAELRGLFAKVAETSGGKEQPDPALLDACVRAALGLAGAEAVRVFRKAWLAGKGLDESAPGRIVAEKRQALRRTPALTFHDAEEGLDDVGGLGELKRWLRERRRAFGADARRFGLPAPRGLLLLGVQGCGKSLCAKAVAREWQFPLLRLDLAAVFGASGSSPELTVREAIAVAESLAPAVLWIDEIEKGFAATEHDARTSRLFGSFLTWLAEKKSPVFVTATANDVTRLPPELLRRGRFDELFFVDLPSSSERAEILAIHLRKHGRDPAQFPLEELASQAERLSGAELAQVVSAALYKAFGEDRDLNDTDIADTIHETVPLYETYEERIKELRNWARTRTRAATLDIRMVDLFGTS
jgi:SpoVK/Ycf46/Vps4 family AAA+-type ATPase